MSSSNRERMKNSESSEISIKSEIEDSFSRSAVKLENDDFMDSVGLFDDDSLFMDPDMEFKAEPEFEAEPEIFESTEGDMKYSFDSDASVSEEDLQISKREVNKEEEEKSVKTGMKEECGIQLGSRREEDKGKERGRGKEGLQNKEEQIENSGCEKPLCQEIDSKSHADVDMREKSFVGGNFEKQSIGVVKPPNTHKLIHTGGQFRCRECDKTFSKKVDLNAHYKTHTRRKSFKCSECDKAFSHKNILTDHHRIHTETKPFKCRFCDKAFSQRAYLTKHHRIHTGEKPFKCSFCDKAFSQRSHLTQHHRIHTGEKPFKCSVCGKSFSQRGTLTHHNKIHTRAIPRIPQVANGGTPSL
ncbi:zinc finger protein OZF-like [Palaemon carinicauda]|uniref:zinc finger protein OZF-like n=1 Tax=Palaemon carinicauda TaxID=392227 RepID=UPI0035B6527C